MVKEFTRQDLHALVWSQPLTKLASEIGVSGTAVAKACARANVPVPPRGYWARKACGQAMTTTELPKRPPGLRDKVVFGGSPYWRHFWPQLSEEELLGPIPPEPVFEDSLEDVRKIIGKSIQHIAVPKRLDRPHPAVVKILKYDKARVEKAGHDLSPGISAMGS